MFAVFVRTVSGLMLRLLWWIMNSCGRDVAYHKKHPVVFVLFVLHYEIFVYIWGFHSIRWRTLLINVIMNFKQHQKGFMLTELLHIKD